LWVQFPHMTMSFMINYILELDTCDVYEYNEIALITFVMAYSIT
jgi:hypothetical protein